MDRCCEWPCPRNGSPRDRSPVCLIRAPTVETFRFATTSITPPLGLAFIAGALEAAGERVTFIDAVAEAPDTFRRYFKGYLLGLPFDEIARRRPRRRQADRDLGDLHPRVAGGGPADRRHQARGTPTCGSCSAASTSRRCPSSACARRGADFLVLGEGEETIVELVRALDAGTLARRHRTASRFRSGDEVVVNPAAQRTLAVDDIAWPAWHHIDLDTYHERRWMGGHVHVDQVGADPRHARLPVPVHLLLVAQHVDAAVDPARPGQGRRRDPVLLRAPRRAELPVPGPHRDHPARSGSSTSATSSSIASLDITWQLPSGTRSEAIDEEVAELLRRTGMINMAYAPESGLRGDAPADQEEDERPTACSRASAPPWSSRAQRVGLHRHRLPARHRGAAPREPPVPRPARRDRHHRHRRSASTWRSPARRSSTASTTAARSRSTSTYFRHILASTSLWSTSTYCEELSNVQLTLGSSACSAASTASKRAAAMESTGCRRPCGTSAVSALAATRAATSRSSQTAFRNGMVSGVETAKAKVRRGWMSRAEEKHDVRAMGRDLPGDPREERARRCRTCRAPADTRELRDTNVIKR